MWETEAIRESRDRRSARPIVSQERKTLDPDGDWRTLREVSAETGIPIGTLRKWCRRDSVDSHLESDGEQTLRLLEMGSVEQHARAMGRELNRSYQPPATSPQPRASRQTPDTGPQPMPPTDAVRTTEYELPTTADEDGEAGQNSVPGTAGEASQTMIVPIDAWNKMLNQLGNLHEAGQQLAEARERAGKAETEAMFLRERLAEMREESRQSPVPSPPLDSSMSQIDSPSSSSRSGGGGAEGGGGGQRVPTEDTADATPVPPAEGREDAERSTAGGSGSHELPAAGDQPETTSFFRYVVRGWRRRRR